MGTKIFGANRGIATSNAIPDNNATALDISSTDAKDYVQISTDDGSEKLTLSAGGHGIQVLDAGAVQCTRSGGWALLTSTPSATVPNFNPVAGDPDTGIGAAAANRLSLIAGGTEALRLGGGGVIGKLDDQVDGTFTATNGSAEITSGSSTAFTTDLHVGSAIELFEGTTSRGVFTVSAIASATALTLDSTVSGLSSSPKTGMTGKTDSGELFAVKNGDSKSILSVNATGVLGLSTTPDPGTSASANNLGIGDANMFDAVTSALRTTIIGNCRNNKPFSFVSGDSSVLIGFEAGRTYTTASNTVAIGANCGDIASGTDNAVIIGMNAGRNAGDDTVYIGMQSGENVTGTHNVAIGKAALDASGSATNCVAIGSGALGAATNNNNIGVGKNAGNAITSGSANICIGGDSDVVATAANQIAIGADAVTDAANKVRLGNTSVTNIDGEVAFNATSDARTKTNVEELALGLDFINALRPVSFTRVHPAEYPDEILDKRFKQGEKVTDEDGNVSFVSTTQFNVETNQPIKDEFDETTRSDGLIAQEVQAVCDSLGVQFNGINTGSQGKLGLQYSLLVSPLIKAVQELTARVAELEAGD